MAEEEGGLGDDAEEGASPARPNRPFSDLTPDFDYRPYTTKFDEVVEQDGVKVLIDSKALFSIIGSEMDWKEDALRYV